MSDDIMADAMELFRSGDLKGAVENLDGKLRANRDNAILQHTYAEFANMLNMEEQDDVVPGTKIMMSYKKAMELDEENDEYIADFASFALECRRVPQAVKEFQRYSRRLEMADIPTDDVLYMAARNIVDTIEVIDPEKANPMVKPWVKQALIWAVGGLGYTPEQAAVILTSEVCGSSLGDAETRLHFRIGYLGDAFHGSQIQPDVRTVQGELIRVFKKLGWLSKDEEGHNLVLSSRTDAGVHVRLNGGTVRIASSLWNSITPRKFVRAVDDLLPDEIAFLDVREVDMDWYPRLAVHRVYRYRLEGMEFWKDPGEVFSQWLRLFEGTYDARNFARLEEGKNRFVPFSHARHGLLMDEPLALKS